MILVHNVLLVWRVGLEFSSTAHLRLFTQLAQNTGLENVCCFNALFMQKCKQLE